MSVTKRTLGPKRMALNINPASSRASTMIFVVVTQQLTNSELE